MNIKAVITILEDWAPKAYQESYDNSGLICGDEQAEVSSVLVSLDCTEAVVDEAISKSCNLIISHHPLVFSAIKTLTGKTDIERALIKAIQNNIALYAFHTNLDAVDTGVNKKIADRLGLEKLNILRPKADTLSQLVTYVPENHLTKLRETLFSAGAGSIGNYSSCSFSNAGMGTFKATGKAQPFVGKLDELHQEKERRLELVFPRHLQSKVISALKTHHPYEEVAYQIIELQVPNPYVGSGMIGSLAEPMDVKAFFERIQNRFQTQVIKHTDWCKSTIKRVAICGGSGSFLLSDAKAAGADVFLTSDFKYHEFFSAENQIIIADVGHYESEYFTIELIDEKLREKNCNFAVYKSELNTNPVNYFYN
ncbi:MAG: Nif3-like dinuclear metal center hexameric protein [Flavobacteriales bacterium]